MCMLSQKEDKERALYFIFSIKKDVEEKFSILKVES